MATIFTYITLLLSHPLSPHNEVPHDSLQGKSYGYLNEKIDEKAGQPAAWAYINSYRDKAKKNADWEELSNAYHFALYESQGDEKLVYADSMIYASQKSGCTEAIGGAYLTKGIVCYNKKEHHPALDNLILANTYISRGSNPYLIHKLKYHLALIKLYLGYYNEAIALLRPCVTFFAHGYPEPYVNCLHSLTLCYSRLGNIREAQRENRFALGECRRLGVTRLLPFIEMQHGVNLYYLARYREAVTSITANTGPIAQAHDFANLAIAHFYIGKSYWQTGEKARAITSFKQVDSIFMNEHYIRPDLREGYELLINYYSDTGHPTQALAYINRLIQIDKAIDKEFVYLSQKVHKEYDTRGLIEARDKMQEQLRENTFRYTASRIAVALLLSACLVLLSGYCISRRRNKLKFDSLMAKLEHPIILPLVNKEPRQEVNPEISQRVLSLLGAFEDDKGFLRRDITATALAEEFRTNYKYLSQVIHEHRDASFTDYINGLRIRYILERLKREPKLRRYKTAGLAEECGFITAQHFTGTFKKVAGMTPVSFIRELEKSTKGRQEDGAGKG